MGVLKPHATHVTYVGEGCATKPYLRRCLCECRSSHRQDQLPQFSSAAARRSAQPWTLQRGDICISALRRTLNRCPNRFAAWTKTQEHHIRAAVVWGALGLRLEPVCVPSGPPETRHTAKTACANSKCANRCLMHAHPTAFRSFLHMARGGGAPRARLIKFNKWGQGCRRTLSLAPDAPNRGAQARVCVGSRAGAGGRAQGMARSVLRWGTKRPEHSSMNDLSILCSMNTCASFVTCDLRRRILCCMNTCMGWGRTLSSDAGGEKKWLSHKSLEHRLSLSRS